MRSRQELAESIEISPDLNEIWRDLTRECFIQQRIIIFVGGDWLSFLESSFDKPTRQNQILEGENHLRSSQALNQTGFKSTRLVWTGGLDILLSSQKKKNCGCHSFDQVQFYMFNIVSTPILILDINFDLFLFSRW